MLGFGDVIMPALLVSFCRGVDVARPARRLGYFPACVIAYVCGTLVVCPFDVTGLLLTYAVLMGSGMAQPALLYLVPW